MDWEAVVFSNRDIKASISLTVEVSVDLHDTSNSKAEVMLITSADTSLVKMRSAGLFLTAVSKSDLGVVNDITGEDTSSIVSFNDGLLDDFFITERREVNISTKFRSREIIEEVFKEGANFESEFIDKASCLPKQAVKHKHRTEST